MHYQDVFHGGLSKTILKNIEAGALFYKFGQSWGSLA